MWWLRFGLETVFIMRLISLTISSRSEYHHSSLYQPDFHLLPHLLSMAFTEDWPFSPTIHSRRSDSTNLTKRNILDRGCSGGSGRLPCLLFLLLRLRAMPSPMKRDWESSLAQGFAMAALSSSSCEALLREL